VLYKAVLCCAKLNHYKHNEYQPKGDDALRRGVKTVEILFVCGWQVKHPLVTHGPYLSAVETHVGHYKALYKCLLLGVAGDIMMRITDAGLGITAMMTVTLDQVNAEEFLQVYKGVVQEYPMMVMELSCGPCIAMEVCGHNALAVLRELAGPPDPVRHASLT